MNFYVFPSERLGLLPSRLWPDTLLSIYIILAHLPTSDEHEHTTPRSTKSGPLFHIDSSWVTLAEILRSPTFAEGALPITLGFLTRLPMTPGKQPALAEKDVVFS